MTPSQLNALTGAHTKLNGDGAEQDNVDTVTSVEDLMSMAAGGW